MTRTDLSRYNNSWYDPGGGRVKRLLWYFTNQLIFSHGLLPFRSLKVALLRAFGARVGKGVNIKPRVNIKYPWLLEIGDHTWIGEAVWIDNLAKVQVGAHCCLSQAVYILTGNHDYSRQTFDLSVQPVVMEEGVWLGAQSVVCPGVTCHSHSVLSVGSIATSDLEAFSVYQGNPAMKVKERIIRGEVT